MGLDIFDVMGAVGGAGKAYSDIKQEDKRAALAKKLQEERDARLDGYDRAREERAEKRDLAEIDPTQTEYQDGEGGIVWKVVRNKRGEPLDKTLATADERETRDYARRNALSTTLSNEANAQLDTTKAAHAEEYVGLDGEIKREHADYYRAQAERARRPPLPTKATTAGAEKVSDREALAGAEQRIQAAGNTPEVRRRMALMLAANPKTAHLAYKIDPKYKEPLK